VTRSFRILGFVLVLAAIAYAASVYSSVPDPVPSHWDASGRVNDTMPKPWGVVLIPALMLVIWAVFAVLPAISPRGFAMDSFARAWGMLTVVTLGFMLFMEVLTLSAARTGAPLSSKTVFVGVGLLIAFIGNLLGKVTRNFFLGIRTPWTLANEDVWNRTHRLGGKLLVAAGLVVVVAALLGLPAWTMIAAIFAGALIPVIYSYVAYRRVEGSRAGGPAAP
jgi:uncharacterized membrane protein